jgi:hypothetical protein
MTISLAQMTVVELCDAPDRGDISANISATFHEFPLDKPSAKT